MDKLRFETQINAPKQKVWDVMLADETYRKWTDVFNPSGGSWYEGSWDKGGTIRFIGPDKEGNRGGMLSRIADNIPYEHIDIEHLGEVQGDKDLPGGPWAGGHEKYWLTEDNGVTKLKVELDSANMPQEFQDMFSDAWPKALLMLKELCEN